MTFIEKIESILPEIDIETGIMYCGDDEELFEEVVGEFVEGEMTASIEKNFKNPAGNIAGGYQWPRLAGGEGHEIEKRIDRRQGY